MKFQKYVLAVLTAAFSLGAQAFTHDKDIIEYRSCDSHSLKIRINAKNKSSKEDIVRATNILAEYEQLRFVPLKGVKRESTFQMRLQYACGEECAATGGWTEIQYRLKVIPGVKLSCIEGVDPDEGGMGQGQQEQKQEQQQDEGGVTGGS